MPLGMVYGEPGGFVDHQAFSVFVEDCSRLNRRKVQSLAPAVGRFYQDAVFVFDCQTCIDDHIVDDNPLLFAKLTDKTNRYRWYPQVDRFRQEQARLSDVDSPLCHDRIDKITAGTFQGKLDD